DWFARDYGKVFVNLFESAAATWLGLPSQGCVFHDFCGKGVAGETDGSVYSCDHYVYPEYRMGNLRTVSLSDMVFSESQKRFGFAKRDTLPRYCHECKYVSRCWGECP